MDIRSGYPDLHYPVKSNSGWIACFTRDRIGANWALLHQHQSDNLPMQPVNCLIDC